VLDRLAVPPRMLLRALDDLHALADGLRRLTDSEADVKDLLTAVRALPGIEEKLSARIDALETRVVELLAWLEPLHDELTDVDDTAETATRETIAGFHRELRELRDRIPGI
jgi:hypothetical protein